MFCNDILNIICKDLTKLTDIKNFRLTCKSHSIFCNDMVQKMYPKYVEISTTISAYWKFQTPSVRDVLVFLIDDYLHLMCSMGLKCSDIKQQFEKMFYNNYLGTNKFTLERAIFVTAAYCGHVELFKVLADNNHEYFNENFSILLDLAALGNQFEIIKYLTCTDNFINQAYNEKYNLRENVSNCSLDILKWFHIHLGLTLPIMTIVCNVANNGKVDIFNWLLDCEYYIPTQTFFNIIIKNGHLHIIESAIARGKFKMNEVLYKLAFTENARIFKFFEETYPDSKLLYGY